MDTNIIYNIDCVAGMNQMIDEESIDLKSLIKASEASIVPKV